MKEYIEREAALNVLKIARGHCSFAYEEITNLPAADVAPVRHGRWKDGVCSECGFDAMYYKGEPVQIYTRYCPACGALMDGNGRRKKTEKTAVLLRKFYQCNRMQCGARCSWPTCRHTADRAYAVRPDAPESDFKEMGGYLWQKIEEEV